MEISIRIPDFVVKAVSGRVAVIVTGAISAGVIHGLGMLGQHYPALVNLIGDPSILADKITIAAAIGVASIGNYFHSQSGSNLGRLTSATMEAATASAANDLAAHGIAAPALPVFPQVETPATVAAPQPGVDVISR